MGDYIYHYVNLPHQVNQVEENMAMINILTPIVNVDEKNIFNNAIAISDQNVKYDLIIQSKSIELNDDKSKFELEPQSTMKRNNRLQKDIYRKKVARMRETEEQRIERLKKDRMRKKQARQNETLDQRQKRLEKDRLRIRKRRALETDEERRLRLEKNRIGKRNARLKENSSRSSINS